MFDLLNTFNAEFVSITPGEKGFPKSFVMGTGKRSNQRGTGRTPSHSISAFAMAKYEVPQNLYEAVMGVNPSRWKGPRNSVEMFDFNAAQAFCRKSTALMRDAKLLADDEEIRLPSEAEWEYCCRAGTTTAYSFGDSAVKPDDAGVKASVLSEFAWHTGNAAGNDPPVGAKKPNAWGLYDMHGYLWEFVSDGWHDTYVLQAPGRRQNLGEQRAAAPARDPRRFVERPARGIAKRSSPADCRRRQRRRRRFSLREGKSEVTSRK